MSSGVALSFEIISSSIRILLTRIAVSIPNPIGLSQTNFFVPDSHLIDTVYVNRSSIDVLTVYALCPSYYFPAAVCLEDISLNEPKQTTLCRRHTHASVSVEDLPLNAGFPLGGSRHKH